MMSGGKGWVLKAWWCCGICGGGGGGGGSLVCTEEVGDNAEKSEEGVKIGFFAEGGAGGF